MHEPHDAGQVCHWNLIMYDCLANTVRFQVFGMLDVSCAHCQGEGNDRSRQSVSGCCSISSSGGGAHAAVAESPARSPHLPPVSPEPIIALVLVVALPPPIPPTRKSRTFRLSHTAEIRVMEVLSRRIPLAPTIQPRWTAWIIFGASTIAKTRDVSPTCLQTTIRVSPTICQSQRKEWAPLTVSAWLNIARTMSKTVPQWARMGRVWHIITLPPFTLSMVYVQPKSRTIFYVQPVLGITLTQRYVMGGHMVMDMFLHMLTLIPTLSHQQGSQMMIQCTKRLNGARFRCLTWVMRMARDRVM